MKKLLTIALLAITITGYSQKRIYFYDDTNLNPKDKWKALEKDSDDYPLYKVEKGDSLILELGTHHWYDRTAPFIYRYVPLDSYPTDLTRGQVKVILRRLDELETQLKTIKKP